ncbi:sensor histidine kinase [Agreia bicolorata]|uniref:sensor histidine kinase n=1 Tax=Agreia bicolorata TaxID=110935 RepID=UPI0013791CA1|nr:histidine kinase [Agreia bicolorata]
MNRLRDATILVGPPLFALVFVGFWLLAEAGRFATDEPRWWLASWLPFALVGASIAVSRLVPISSLAIVGALLVGQLLGVLAPLQDTSWPVYLGLLVTATLVSWSGSSRYLRGVVVVFAAFSVLLAAQVTFHGVSAIGTGDPLTATTSNGQTEWLLIVALSILFFSLALCCWFIGFAHRVRLERAEAAAQRLAVEEELASSELEVTLASERDRIAQDVHDIMAHSLSVIVAQADGARYLSQTRPEVVGTALDAIASSARDSLVEVRMLMDALSSEPQGHSQPALRDLADLIGRMVSAGLPVTMDVFGDAKALSAAQQLAVYRIVQESLTNALRHAGPDATARVALDWRGLGLALSIGSTGGPTIAEPEVVQSAELFEGRGIRGMRERARIAGGWLTAGPERTEGGPSEFIVTAFLPVQLEPGGDDGGGSPSGSEGEKR